MREDRRAIALDVLREANTVTARKQLFELASALPQRQRSQFPAVQLDQIEVTGSWLSIASPPSSMKSLVVRDDIGTVPLIAH